MGRKITLWKDPYDEGIELFSKRSITFNPGVTVLVGCNGIGKTTMLQNIKSELKKKNIPVLSFDNLKDGGSNAVSKKAFYNDFGFVATSIQSSEGENIIMNLVELSKRIGKFVRTGEDTNGEYGLERILSSFNKENEKQDSKERWILLDATDSGLSVDNVIDLKETLFKTILNNSGENDVYIVVSANEFEMANGERCLDVSTCKFSIIKTYQRYKNLIMKSRTKKDMRY